MMTENNKENPVINHLLFHKALISEDEANDRINKYISLVETLQEGAHISIKDPFEKSIAITFELVLEHHMNPWDIDLVKFSHEYLKRVKEEKDIDLVAAGKLIVMAWSILKLQSDEAILTYTPKEEPHADSDWDAPEGDWFTNDMNFDFTQMVLNQPRPPIQEMIWRKGDRPVTLLELVNAFEEAKNDVEILQILRDKRQEERERLARLGLLDVGKKMHKEDLEADINLIYGRICKYNGHPISFSCICSENDVEDRVTALVSSLYLAHTRKIDVWQEEFPYGEIFIRNLHSDGSKESGSDGDLRPIKLKRKSIKPILKNEIMQDLIISRKRIAS